MINLFCNICLSDSIDKGSVSELDGDHRLAREPETNWLNSRGGKVFHVTVVPSHEAIAIILPIYLKLHSQFFFKLHLHRILLNEKSQIQYMDWVIFPLLYLS